MSGTAVVFHAPRSCPAAAEAPVPRRVEPQDPIAVAFGEALRSARKARGLSLEAVAHHIPRLDPRYLGEIELGWHSPTIVTAKRLADALGVPLAEIVRDL